MESMEAWLKYAPQPEPLAGPHKWHVFLSYRSVNRPWVINLYDILSSRGFNVFLDQYVLPSSSQLVGGLDAALTTSQAGILVWSADASDSAWCQREYEAMERRAARDPRFHYVIAKLDAAKLPPFAANHIHVDFSTCREGPRGKGLLELLHGVLGRPLPPEAVVLGTAVDQETRDALAAIQGGRLTGDASCLRALADSDSLAWNCSPLLRCAVADAFIAISRNDDALDVLDMVERAYPRTIRVKQLRGLALARSGRTVEAQRVLAELYAAGERDPETLGIYARTWMDLYAKSGDRLHLKAARDRYIEAFESSPSDYYTGINAAAKSVLLNDVAAGTEYARRVQQLVGAAPSPADYWRTATAAEAALICGEWAAAARLYDAAVAMAPGEHGSHRTTWLQAERLMAALGTPAEDKQRIAAVFSHVAQKGA